MLKAFRVGLSMQGSQRGAVVVELAILIVPLLMLAIGVTEYGRAIYQYNTLVKSVRDATRYLSAVAPGSGWGAAQCLAVYGNANCSGNVLVQDLKPSMVKVCDATDITDCLDVPHSAVPTGHGSVNLVTVTVTGYTFQPLFNFQLAGFTIGAPEIEYGPIRITMRQAS